MSIEQSSPELVNLEPLGRIHPGSALPVLPTDCADDAPC